MLYPVIGLPPFDAGADQDNCTPLPLAGEAVRFCGAEGTVIPGGVAVAVFVAAGVFVGVGVLVGVGVCEGVAVAVGVPVFVAVGVAVAVGVLVGVCVGVAVAVGVGVEPPLPHEANLKLPMRVRQLNCDEPVG